MWSRCRLVQAFWSPTWVGCDAAHDTDTPNEELGDFGTDVRRVGRLSCGLRVDALKPGLVGAGGVALADCRW